jgi:hypothetical protein
VGANIMKTKLFFGALLVGAVLFACNKLERIRIPYKYSIGQKVELKVGNQEAIILQYVYPHHYYKGHPYMPRYIVRVGYKNSSHLDWFSGASKEISKFTVKEFEIEKALDGK